MTQSALTALPRRLDGIPLFGNVGRPVVDADIERIGVWVAWPGPEAEGTLLIVERQQRLHDELVPPDEEGHWRAALRAAVDQVGTSIPYDPDEDAWHAPTAAAWHAAWTFTLEAVHLSRGLALPADLRTQIDWFVRGHWPCSVRIGRSGHELGDYVIF